MRIRMLTTFAGLGLALLVGGCANKRPDITYEGWQKQAKPEIEYTSNDVVKITLNWSRIGPFSRYDTRVRSSVFGGRIDVYGAQTCLGQFIRNDSMLPANGWWDIVCPDDSYAAGNFRLGSQGNIIGSGVDINGEPVTFDLPIPN
jgi:hypothetical protein